METGRISEEEKEEMAKELSLALAAKLKNGEIDPETATRLTFVFLERLKKAETRFDIGEFIEENLK